MLTAALGAVVLAACSTGSRQQVGTSTSAPAASSSMTMNHGGSVPAGMKATARPKYPVGSAVILTADHMGGMSGARAIVVGAYSTYTYAVDYTPTTGGAIVKNHKWVVQQEIRNAGSRRLANGSKVVLATDHMSGMSGATATIAGSTDQTVYVVNYTDGGTTIKDHKWVVQDEMKPAS